MPFGLWTSIGLKNRALDGGQAHDKGPSGVHVSDTLGAMDASSLHTGHNTLYEGWSKSFEPILFK